jgi:3-phosphoshikimate 1-carboxyvinyltransferase
MKPDPLEIRPVRGLDAVITAPGSKSYTQRALVIASLAEGESVLLNPLIAEDTLITMDALRQFGADIKVSDGMIRVIGTGGRIAGPPPGREIALGNNGTAMRLLLSVAALGKGGCILTGSPRLCERPVQPLLDALAQLGADAKSIAANGCPPVLVGERGLRGGRAVLENIESSQFVSSLLIAAPYAENDTVLEVRGEVPSRPYVDMTVQAMADFGSRAVETSGGYFVRAGRRYSGRDYRIEGDASSATYFFAAAALCGGRVSVENINPSTLQGDIRLLCILERMGCRVSRGDYRVEVEGAALGAGELSFDMGDMPDAVPTAAVLAATRPGRTAITNIAHLRVKESNRICALVTELRKTGVRAEELQDGMIIEGGSPRGAVIETYNDHRIAMSFAVLGLAVPGMKIVNPGCVAKSFPGFWKALETL